MEQYSTLLSVVPVFVSKFFIQAQQPCAGSCWIAGDVDESGVSGWVNGLLIHRTIPQEGVNHTQADRELPSLTLPARGPGVVVQGSQFTCGMKGEA
jgi:hypothetical protein